MDYRQRFYNNAANAARFVYRHRGNIDAASGTIKSLTSGFKTLRGARKEFQKWRKGKGIIIK